MVYDYFTCANSSQGFVDYFASNLEGMRRIFILKGGPGTGKSTLMKKVGGVWAEQGYDVEHIHCSSDCASLDGVVIPRLRAAIVDGTAPHVIEPKALGALEEYVNLGDAWDCSLLRPRREDILCINRQISGHYQNIYQRFALAKEVHDRWEQVYIQNLDTEKAAELGEHLVELLLGDNRAYKPGHIRHRFFGAPTPNGPVNFIDNLTSTIGVRYFIKGRPGTGKSTLLRRVSDAALERGYDVECYYCSFDPNSLDMVIVRELDVCIFDSTAPHELFPERASDKVVDVYAQLIQPGTDEAYAEELACCSREYSQIMHEGTRELGIIKTLHDELESIYINAVNFKKVDRITKQIIKDLQEME